MRKTIDAAIGQIASAESLDQPSYILGKLISRTRQVVGKPAKSLANTLHGQSYGHPVHPLIVAVPIGTWTLALGLDLLATTGLRERSSGCVADLSLRVGSVGAAAAIATGLADWQQLNGRDRRVGLVHGTVNLTALSLNLLSSRLRGQGRRAAGVWASFAAYACMFVGGYLGGHLVYRRRVAVDHADRSPEPRDFRPVLPLAELREKAPHRVAVWDEVARKEIGIVLVRQGDEVHAMGALCSHAGGPLDQGWVLDGTLVCPWHGSRYNLETGQPSAGPSTCPQPRYQVLLRDGMVELRREQEPGDQVVTAESLAGMSEVARASLPIQAEAVAKARKPDDAQRGKTATEVLFEHHEMLRRLFEQILTTSGGDVQRHELMRALAAELDIHEVVEDKLFYPAVRTVSEDTEMAYAEHGVLADLLAATIKLPLASPEFREHLLALQAAFLHHSGSEERSMFREAERLSQAQLRELGDQLKDMLDRERTSRFRQAFRNLKISLVERV